ncbi:hypothetical protein QE422_003431 [Chryseobacterium sp. SORGH_AS 447]|uniref:hypothetical protein n=1 Tax=Chryseobacterium sp. SORGH_AS_0447 TaxID=3041769 RepID=UPI00278209E7|nr:hypothetical protein [Chryseobacterium sp. SORGH_AS_0447]MDQ1163063.1 hypothetical protein [Chryseobacterium sp. SORGH_AS_0447]
MKEIESYILIIFCFANGKVRNFYLFQKFQIPVSDYRSIRFTASINFLHPSSSFLSFQELFPAFCCIFFAWLFPLQKKDAAAIGAKAVVIQCQWSIPAGQSAALINGQFKFGLKIHLRRKIDSRSEIHHSLLVNSQSAALVNGQFKFSLKIYWRSKIDSRSEIHH